LGFEATPTGNFALPDARETVPVRGDLFVAIQAAKDIMVGRSGALRKTEKSLKNGALQSSAGDGGNLCGRLRKVPLIEACSRTALLV